jgi:predicted phosphodiesterase
MDGKKGVSKGGDTVGRVSATAVLVLAGVLSAAMVDRIVLPMKEGSIRFLVIGDSGTGGGAQRQVAERIAEAHKQFPFEFAIMLGDNLYGGEGVSDYRRKFEEPYKPLLDADVKFFAALGNHDDPAQRFYKAFNMNGERYYSFKAPKPGIGSRGGARFFALDSNYMAQEQLDWFKKELAASGSEWKIAYFHHPIYSSGERHGSNLVLREQIEPLFLEHGVDVVFTGHEHFYERLKPQKGITYFVAGSSAKLRRGNIETQSELTAKGFDRGYTFMIVEIAADEMHFQTIDAEGKTVDSGVIKRREVATATQKSPSSH